MHRALEIDAILGDGPRGCRKPSGSPSQRLLATVIIRFGTNRQHHLRESGPDA
jgi:hypothetical protein